MLTSVPGLNYGGFFLLGILGSIFSYSLSELEAWVLKTCSGSGWDSSKYPPVCLWHSEAAGLKCWPWHNWETLSQPNEMRVSWNVSSEDTREHSGFSRCSYLKSFVYHHILKIWKQFFWVSRAGLIVHVHLFLVGYYLLVMLTWISVTLKVFREEPVRWLSRYSYMLVP